MMYAWMGRALHLHHSNPAAKLAGLPGDQLAHAKCNIRAGGQLGASITNSRTGTGRRTVTGGGTVTGRATVTPIKTVTVRQSRQW
jgi:hypothetical protein